MSNSIDDNKALIARYIAAFNTANLTLFGQVFDRDVIDHNPPPQQGPGLEGIMHTFRVMSAAFPDTHGIPEDMVAEGDKVAMRMTIRATHQGEFRGVQPTGKPISMTRISIFRVANGKIVEWWHNEDMLGMLRQLGLS